MPSLSSPISDLQPEYGVVVIGSGYGGAIAACRMAERARTGHLTKPSFSVALFERGIERQAGDFPTTLTGALRQFQTDTSSGRVGSRTGLFDFRINHDVSVLVGCGLGGTSLINAGVMLRPTSAVLRDKRWPKAFHGTSAIERHFATVENTLNVSKISKEILLDKVQWLSKAAEGLELRVNAAPVAISFTTQMNQFDVQQKRCILCGNCITGCNHSAKNTVAVNYLPAAVGAGATVFCQIETRAIQPGPNGEWLVHVRLNDRTLRPFGSPDIIIRAQMVFLAAGTLGSTEILLRSRDQYGLTVSDFLGEQFSGNGDVIAFGYNTPDRANGFGYGDSVPRDAAVGPTITAVIDERAKPGTDSMMIQEGAIPGALRFPLRFAAPIMARATHIVGDIAFDFRWRHIRREIDSLIRGVRHGALARTQTFLAMGVHDGSGSMSLSHDRLRIAWPGAGYHAVYHRIAARLQDMTRLMKGRYVINPFWSRVFGRRLITAHPLGGCCIGDDPNQAVVDATGQVFSGSAGNAVHRHLYVCDGSTIPMPLGTNPALTISALAEHIVQGATRDPMLGTLPPPSAKATRINPAVAGLKYAERVRGWLYLDKGGTPFEIILHMSAENVEDLVNARDHLVRLVGVAHSPGLPVGQRHWTISNGTLNVLIDDPRTVDTKLLVYRFTMTNSAGDRRLWFRGHKVVNMNTLRRDPWLALTEIPFVVYGADPDESQGSAVDLCAPGGLSRKSRAIRVLGDVETWDRSRNDAQFLSEARRRAHIVGAGVLRSTVWDAINLSRSMRVTYEKNILRRLRWRWRYNKYFFSTVIPLRLWALRRTRRINPFDPQDKFSVDPKTLARPLKDRRERPRFTVTRYRGTASTRRTRGPVMLAPGFGMSTLAFHALGADSFAEYLHREGYDVWLFDYRASDKLDVSLEQFDIDELAKSDFPDAIKKVSRKTRKKVRIVAHCLASMTMQMGLLSGRIETNYVRSMLLSQSFAFIDLPWPTRLKVRLRLPEILTYLNFRTVVTSDFDVRSRMRTRILDRLLYFFPSKERCHEGVCRRLLLLYGEVARHQNLDQRTHEIFYHLFDRGNLAAFKHIGSMFMRGRIGDRNGDNIYLLPENANAVNIPITLLQGTANNMFRPSGAEKTHKWLLRYGPFGDRNKDMFDLVKAPGYGHLDSFIGKDAPDDVFPLIKTALERMDQLM